jgi:hypothetical protein
MTRREATPRAPDNTRRDGGNDPKEPQRGAVTPLGNKDSSASARNTSSGAPAKPETGDARAATPATDKWGDLPVHVRDVFRAQGGGDMPAQYRDWIDAYYRRMAKRNGS